MAHECLSKAVLERITQMLIIKLDTCVRVSFCGAGLNQCVRPKEALSASL